MYKMKLPYHKSQGNIPDLVDQFYFLDSQLVKHLTNTLVTMVRIRDKISCLTVCSLFMENNDEISMATLWLCKLRWQTSHALANV